MTTLDYLELIRMWAGWALLAVGSGALVIGAMGLFRLPDFYTRAHAAGVTDTGGAIGVLSGLIILSPSALVAAKLAVVLAVLLFASPTACHALARAAFRSGLRPQLDGNVPPPARPLD